jgi:hypothetical protein
MWRVVLDKLRHDPTHEAESECVERPEATARFDALVRKVLEVPHMETIRREAGYRN